MAGTKIAFVNGEAVRPAPRARPDLRYRNEKIEWLVVHAPGELGEKGMAIDPAGGGGSRDPFKREDSATATLERSFPAVRRWRAIWMVWEQLEPLRQRRLTARYRDTERQHSEVVGLRAAFGELAGLAWHLCPESERGDLRDRLSNASGKRDKVIEAHRKRTEDANREDHEAWIAIEASTRYRKEFG